MQLSVNQTFEERWSMLPCKHESQVVSQIQPAIELLIDLDVHRNGQTTHTAEILADLAVEVSGGELSVLTIYDDHIPDERRSRRWTRTTRYERILVMKKG